MCRELQPRVPLAAGTCLRSPCNSSTHLTLCTAISRRACHDLFFVTSECTHRSHLRVSRSCGCSESL